MKIQDKIKIGGHWVDVIKVKNDILESQKMGMSICSNNKIVINTNFPTSQVDEAFLHEIAENINSSHEYGLEHNVLQSFCCCLYQVLHDNKLKF